MQKPYKKTCRNTTRERWGSIDQKMLKVAQSKNRNYYKIGLYRGGRPLEGDFGNWAKSTGHSPSTVDYVLITQHPASAERTRPASLFQPLMGPQPAATFRFQDPACDKAQLNTLQRTF